VFVPVFRETHDYSKKGVPGQTLARQHAASSGD
jgi:hypothetical protein